MEGYQPRKPHDLKTLDYLLELCFPHLCAGGNIMRCLSSVPHRDVVRIKWLEKKKEVLYKCKGGIFILTVASKATCVHEI